MRLDAATGIGPEVVERLTTGPTDELPNGRADAGTESSGAPSPRRCGSAFSATATCVAAPAGGAVVAERWATGGGGAGVADAEEGALAASGGAEAAWRLTTGIAGDEPLGTRRIPPETGMARGAAPAAAASAAAAARCTAAGRAALAAEVSGRSGTWIVWRETVGMLRIGGARGSAGASGSACETDGAAIAGAGIGAAATAAGAGASAIGDSAAGAAYVCTEADCAGRAARRWTGAGMDPPLGASTGRVRATTRPGVARWLTSCPSCCTIGGNPCDPGSDSAKEPGAATSGISPVVRWIGGRLAQA
jgi:hypothetical protein